VIRKATLADEGTRYQMLFGDKMVFGTGEGQVVSPSPRNLGRFRAGGKYIDEEVAPMLGALTEMFETAGPQGFEDAARKFRHGLSTLAGAEGTVRKMTGAYVSKDRMMGDVVRGSDALVDWEVYVPGLGVGAYSMARFPTQGESTPRPQPSLVAQSATYP
jgi:hypothetical protein